MVVYIFRTRKDCQEAQVLATSVVGLRQAFARLHPAEATQEYQEVSTGVRWVMVFRGFELHE